MAMDYTLLSEKAVDLLAALCRGENVSDVSFPFTLIDRGSISSGVPEKYTTEIS